MARKQKVSTSIPNDEEIEWLQEDHADLLDYNMKLADEIDELRQENRLLKEQVDQLGAELNVLKSAKILSKVSVSDLKVSTNLVPELTLKLEVNESTKELSSREKIRLFRSLFRGREDVFAKRWESRTGKSGYSPACSIEWNRQLCGKAFGKKCLQCRYNLYTEEITAEHLGGQKVCGVYPLLNDDTCWFLAVDFDGERWQQDSLAYLRTCRDWQVPAYLERSRSGNGGHIWVFMDRPVLASTVRKLGSTLLSSTMETYHHLQFSSYDRFFPNQDSMPKGGFGNLIALPLQGRSRAEGNAVFIDDNLEPFSDQWAFLQAVEKLTLERVELIVAEATIRGNVLGVRLPSTEEEDTTDPWSLPPSGPKKQKKIAGPLPSSVHIVQSNMLFIENSYPSPLLTKLKRLAAFQNPEFYKKQKMRLPIYETPRIIGCAEDHPKHIALPRSLLSEVSDLLTANGIELTVDDRRQIGQPVEFMFHGDLRGEQETACQVLLQHDIGVLSASTGFGKTVIGAAVVATRRVNTLIVVHTRELLDQWRERLAFFLKISPKEIGQFGGGKKKLTGRLDIATIQSLVQKNVVNDLVGDYGQLIVDECHHLSAFSFEKVAKQVKAKYVLGLTATPIRKDGHHPIIFMQCGPIRYRADAKKQAAKRPFDHIVIPRYTALTEPRFEYAIQDVYTSLTGDRKRNQLIVDDILEAVQEGRNPLVLVERKAHLEEIQDMLSERGLTVVTMVGGMTKRERTARLDQLRSEDRKSYVLLATGRYIGEGFDDSILDTLFLAHPISWKGTLQQYAGRLHRLHAGKLEVRIYDYIDSQIPMLNRMYGNRKTGYKSMGYEITDTKVNGDKDSASEE